MNKSEEHHPNVYGLKTNHTYLHSSDLPTAKQSLRVGKMSLHVGPLPAAKDLEEYSKIGKDGEVLRLILDMAKKNNDTQNKTALRAQWFTFISDISKTVVGLIFGLTCLLGSYYLAVTDHPYMAGILGSTALLIGLSVLVMRANPFPEHTKKVSPHEGDKHLS
ncbi:hypothetical protein GS501_04530 [Saccharibacter sp. 17.LH.SD]|uniref:hypothetical protein n=1 Tax=Saccharibacter sp. 17.LH.SD TaxID=2689393 RepID=UPI00137022C7|nr:hypothetical protein [Saccharibacter sp. 17.LH.SD]MXV44311.1 hypothetical protein [Saccharibacter sp. 17.LH.SD]